MKEKVDFPTFIEIAENFRSKTDPKEEVLLAFEKADKTKSGMMPVRALRSLMLNTGEKMSEGEFNEMMRALCIESRGNINYNSIVNELFEEFPDIPAVTMSASTGQTQTSAKSKLEKPAQQEPYSRNFLSQPSSSSGSFLESF